MSLIYAAEADALKARDRAFTLDEARRAASQDADGKLRWMMTAVDDAYAPYLVKIHALAGSQATISFIDCTTGEVMDERITIDLGDRELVWNRLPSTLDGWSAGTTDCAFLFLSSKIKTLTSLADESGGGQGKWPRGAAVAAVAATSEAELDEARGVVRELLADPVIRERLSEPRRQILARLAGEDAS
jgi:hypothetical protein